MKSREDALWESIGKDGYDVEHSMDMLHRKQTGSYYTALDLALAMMRELVGSLSEEKRRSLCRKSFLEPCVGTGNFVFAYLRVCKELGFTQAEYRALLENIYVCDINRQALSVYRKNLSAIAAEYFSVELDEGYFRDHIGSGLLFDVDSDEIRYIPIADVFPKRAGSGGFDLVVTNPPYKNLKAERGHYASDALYEADKKKYAAIGKLAKKLFPFSSAGTINLYKLFVEEISRRYLAPDGAASLLIPASILSDKTCSKLRTHLLETASLKSIRIIAEDSEFLDSSQALCAVLFHNGGVSDTISVGGSFDGNPTNGLSAKVSDIIDRSTGNAILVLQEEEYAQRRQMRTHPTIGEIEYIHNLRGELDLTSNKGSIRADETPYRLIRGRHIGYYRLLELSKKEYAEAGFVAKTAKQPYIHSPRLACQQIVNMAKKRRISFTYVPEEVVLGNSCNFISVEPNDDGVDMYFLLGVLNSPMINWYFKLTSSNNHINNYEIDNFPIPVSYKGKHRISALVQEYLESGSEETLNRINRLVDEAYGLAAANAAPDHVSGPPTVFNDPETLNTAFFNDLAAIIPGFPRAGCDGLLNGSLLARDIAARYHLSKFDAKVAGGIIAKYLSLSEGRVLNHTTFKLSALDLEMMKPVPQGGSWKDIPAETVKKSKRLEKITQTGGRTTLYGRIDYSQPSFTITTYFNRPGNGTYFHPTRERVLSVREAARFQCFPDSYYFCGNKTEMLKQVGNAVPVLLAYSIGMAIREKTGCRTSVDLFSGAGGMTYGFKCAGIEAVVANDIKEPACITLKVNNPEIPVICGDVTEQQTKTRIIQKGLEGGADMICGGPPCQGFSMAGWRRKDDPRNQLFRHFVDIVSRVNPKVIVFENVEGILSYQGGQTYRDIIALFSELGYITEGRKLMASRYGVPQRRKRVIILCTRKDIGVLPGELFPAPVTPNQDKQMTAYETIYDLEGVECSESAKYACSYTSPLIDFFKGSRSAAEYMSAVADPRGTITGEASSAHMDQMSLFD